MIGMAPGSVTLKKIVVGLAPSVLHKVRWSWLTPRIPATVLDRTIKKDKLNPTATFEVKIIAVCSLRFTR